MRLSIFARYFLHTALILLVLAGVGNIHSHLCLDGQEPAISVHFENLNGHPDHEGDKAHDDVDNELMTEVLPGKSVDQDNPLFLAAVCFLFCVRVPQRQYYVVHRESRLTEIPAYLQPPLRAPPHHSS
jgi:hypothetical protein